MTRVYLDHNATTPLREEARAAMIAAMDMVGNPSSVHAEGRAAKAVVEKARAQVAEAIGAEDAEIVFTSSATEAAALALRGDRNGASANWPSPIEHDAVFSWYGCGGSDGPDMLDEWTFDKNGVLIPSFGQGVFEMAIEGGDILSVAAANSETGILTNVSNFAASSFKAHRHLKPLATHRLFVDATQALGKAPFSFHDSKADFAICSAHKLGGPKGIGALVMRRGIDLDPLVKGGGQEMGRRAGTENVIGIAGFGAAAEAAARDVAMGRWEEVAEKRDFLETSIAATANKTIFVGNGAPRLPNTSCFAVPGWKGETQVMQMDLAGFAISAGSACSSGKVKQSRVLTAMGYDKVTAGSAIRVSLGLETTTDDVARFADAWSAAYRKFCAKVA